jgi:hypothetical protein
MAEMVLVRMLFGQILRTFYTAGFIPFPFDLGNSNNFGNDEFVGA